VENGSSFVPGCSTVCRRRRRRCPAGSRGPGGDFKRHVWINPFWEDDVHALVETMAPTGSSSGSDWPHMEGLAQPLDYLDEVKSLTEADQSKILRDNAESLNTPNAPNPQRESPPHAASPRFGSASPPPHARESPTPRPRVPHPTPRESPTPRPRVPHLTSASPHLTSASPPPHVRESLTSRRRVPHLVWRVPHLGWLLTGAIA